MLDLESPNLQPPMKMNSDKAYWWMLKPLSEQDMQMIYIISSHITYKDILKMETSDRN